MEEVQFQNQRVMSQICKLIAEVNLKLDQFYTQVQQRLFSFWQQKISEFSHIQIVKVALVVHSICPNKISDDK